MIEVHKYDPIWRTRFEKLKAKIWPAVSKHADRIEHVGSTSVEGLWAKPVIDLDIVVDSKDRLLGVIEGLGTLGYAHLGDLGIEGREAFRDEKPEFQHNLYVCVEECLAFRNHMILRDHLRRNTSDRDEYSRLKRGLAKRFPHDIDSYIDGKTEFIVSILKRYSVQSDDLVRIENANKKF